MTASALSLRQEPRKLRDVLFLVTFAIGFIAQLIYGLRVYAHPDDVGAQHTVAAVVVALFLVGIARSWELIDGPSIGIRHESRRGARQERITPATETEPGTYDVPSPTGR